MADNLMGDIPLELQPQMQDISQQQKLSQMLLQQGMQQPQGQMISGHYVKPAFTQYLNPLFSAYAGSKGIETAEQKQLELAKQLREGKSEALSTFQQLMSKPETRAQAMQYAAKSPYLQGMAQELMKPRELAPEAKLVMPSFAGGAPVELAFGGAKMSEAMRGYELAKSQGFPGTFVEYETALKRAGAPSVSVSMEKGIANQIGPMLKEAKPQAVSAVKGIDAANQVIGAIDSNKMYAGPLANTRLSIAQIGTSLGVGGKDTQDKINNTRSAIQGLAEITLQGRQEMHGQGAITESEGKLAERAKSGDISFTPGELKQLANAAKRAGEYTYGNYQAQIQSLAKNPETAQLVPFFQVNQMPERKMPSVVEQPNVNEQLNIPSTGVWRVKQ